MSGSPSRLSPWLLRIHLLRMPLQFTIFQFFKSVFWKAAYILETGTVFPAPLVKLAMQTFSFSLFRGLLPAQVGAGNQRAVSLQCHRLAFGREHGYAHLQGFQHPATEIVAFRHETEQLCEIVVCTLSTCYFIFRFTICTIGCLTIHPAKIYTFSLTSKHRFLIQKAQWWHSLLLFVTHLS